MLDEIQPGTRIDDRYVIVSPLGFGGMGSVYLARELALDREVAIKFLHTHLAADNESILRFEREGKIMVSLLHGNILRCYRYGIWQHSLPYMVTELLEGEALSETLRREGKLNWRRVLKIIRQIADGLENAHAKGVVHRDLKPNNIFLSSDPVPDTVKLLDFGLASLIEMGAGLNDANRQKLTQTGLLLGTPPYMSPEQCMGKILDQRSDIYSFGCVIFEMLCGRTPFVADSPIAYVHFHATEPPPLPSTFLSGQNVPMELEALILRCLDKDLEKRFQNCAEMVEAIDHLITGRFENLNLTNWMPDYTDVKGTSSSTPVVLPIIMISAVVCLTLAGLSLVLPQMLGQKNNIMHSQGTGGLALRESALERMAKNASYDPLADAIHDICVKICQQGRTDELLTLCSAAIRASETWIKRNESRPEALDQIFQAYSDLEQMGATINDKTVVRFSEIQQRALLERLLNERPTYSTISTVAHFLERDTARDKNIMRTPVNQNYLNRALKLRQELLADEHGTDDWLSIELQKSFMFLLIDSGRLDEARTEFKSVEQAVKEGTAKPGTAAILALTVVINGLLARGWEKEALSLAKAVVDLHKGEINYHPDAYHYLPTLAAQLPTTAQENRQAFNAFGGRLYIDSGRWPERDESMYYLGKIYALIENRESAFATLRHIKAPYQFTPRVFKLQLQCLQIVQKAAEKAGDSNFASKLEDEIAWREKVVADHQSKD